MWKIPNLTELRQGKPGYESRYELDTLHALYTDPLVDPREAEFGFEASSWYTKPNSLTGGVLIPGLPDVPLVRRDVAQRLVRADKFLRTDPNVKKLLGAPACLRIDDALRPYAVQKFAYEVAWPLAIKHKNPQLTDEDIAAQVPNYCAKPSKDHPTPHMTGGAVDVALINVSTGEPFNI